jgi:leucyl aminopeptidase
MTDKHATIQPDREQSATQIHVVTKAGLEDFLRALPGNAVLYRTGGLADAA